MAYSLFETAELGPLMSKNRTVRSATNEHLSDPSGQITPAWVDSLEAVSYTHLMQMAMPIRPSRAK